MSFIYTRDALDTKQLITEQIYASGFAIIDNFFPKIHADALLALAKKKLITNQFFSAKIGNETTLTRDKTVRQDKIFWLDESNASDSVVNDYFKSIQEIIAYLNQMLYLGLFDFETHLSYYAPGSFYKKHVDQFLNKQTRKISWVYYLNIDWKTEYGGHLSLYDKEETLLTHVYPLFNRLVCFKSDLPHEVNVTHQERFSIAGWMKTRASSGINQ